MGLMGSRRVLLGAPGLPTPSLDLNYASTMALAGSETFTRASTGWYFNSSGVLTSAATNAARFDYDPATLAPRGLLIEEARTNLFLNSAVGVTQSCTVAAAANTVSFFGTGTITLSGVSTAGPLVGTGATTRVSLTFTPTAGSLTLTVSGSATNVQLELGAFASSPIVTVGSTVTRAIENCTMTLGSWFNSSAGTWAFEFSRVGVAAGVAAVVYEHDGGVNGQDSGGVFFNAASNAIAFGTRVGTTLTNLNDGSDTVNVVQRLASAYAAADKAIALNGGTVASATTAITAVAQTRIALGNRPDGLRPVDGYIRRVRYFDRRLPNALFQRLTT